MRIATKLFFLLFSITCVFAQPPKPQSAPKTIYIHAGHIFDATSESLRDNVVIVVEGDRIKSVAPAT